ncbi:MAG: DUF892 family protein [Flavobacteriaceae bacterium]|nr:DUF892 family protein [Flavobacteriaceae bacterium]
MQTINNLLSKQLLDLKYLDGKQLALLPKFIEVTKNESLKKHLKDIQRLTQKHRQNMMSNFNKYNYKPLKTNTLYISCVCREVQCYLEYTAVHRTESGLISCLQQLLLLKISILTSANRFAKELNLNGLQIKLQNLLNEVYENYEVLDRMAEERLTRKAIKEMS